MYLYSYVPKAALSQVLQEGLFSAEALLNRPDLTELAAKARDKSVKEFDSETKERLKDPFWRPALVGPNVFFQFPPKDKKLSSKHPLSRMDLAPIRIDYGALKRDFPRTRLFGMELEPYKEGAEPEDRARYLSGDAASRLSQLSPEKLWATYNDIEDKGLYAPDVPHASVHIPGGVIPPKYIASVSPKDVLSKRRFLNNLFG